MLEAAYDLLLSDGLGLVTENLTYKRVFDHLERTRGIRVTRASVHERIWPSQRDFQVDVLRHAVRWEVDGPIQQTAEAVALVLSEADLETSEGRSRTLREAIRVGARANLEASESDNLWMLSEVIAAVVSVSRDQSGSLTPIREEVEASYNRATDELVQFYGTMLEALGLEVRPDLGLSKGRAIRTYAMTVMALSEGASLRRRFSTDFSSDLQLLAGDEDAQETWDPFSLGFLALTKFFFQDREALLP